VNAPFVRNAEGGGVSPIADKRVPVQHVVLGLWMVAALAASVGPILRERPWWTWLVLSFTFVLSHLATSGAVPAAMRSQLFALRIKTVPFLVVWVILQIDLWSHRRGAQPRQSISSPSDVLATN